MFLTKCPSARHRRTKFLPMNPSPPVTTIMSFFTICTHCTDMRSATTSFPANPTRCAFSDSSHAYETVPMRRRLEVPPRGCPASHQEVENTDTMLERSSMLLIH